MTAEATHRIPLSSVLQEAPVIAVLRAEHAREYAPVIEALLRGGVRSIELTLSTRGVFEELPELAERFGTDAEIGVGTITSLDEATAALDAGARFLVTPTMQLDVIGASVARGVPVFPGGLTPTELLAGWQAGATAVKVFPAATVGAGYVKQLRGPFPDMQVVPSGGVGLDEAVAWTRAGAAAVSVGGPMLGDAFAGGDLGALTERAKSFLGSVPEGSMADASLTDASARSVTSAVASPLHANAVQTDVVTIGETMALLSPRTFGSLAHVPEMMVGIGGSESNVAIAMRRLGASVTWVGRVGADSLGDRIVREVRGEGVQVIAAVDEAAPTGLMLKERRTNAVTRVHYYRAGSAGSRLETADVPLKLVRGARLLHVTGITPALSPSAAAAIDAAVDAAVEAGVPVALDVNHRAKLWSRDAARAALTPLVARASVVFAGDDEAAMLVGEGSPEELARRLAALGPQQAVVKLGDRGAIALVDGELHQRDAVRVDAIDTVGAGDAFVAGYLAELLAGEPVERRLDTAVRVGAFACLVPGDWEGMPTRAELALLDGGDPVRR